LLIFDALHMEWREVRVRRNPDCPVCGDDPTQTGLIDYEIFCGVKPAPGEDAGPPVPEIDALETRTRLEGDDPPFLLDVREPWEWSIGSLEAFGALLIPLNDLPERLHEVPRDRSVVIYCRSGQRSETAARRLMEAGYPAVYNLRGGVLAWARDVDPDLLVV
jgi:adenylyltransferase/sulfurtransferase